MTEAGYRPADRLYLWLLAQPQQPLFVGELYLVRAVARVVSGWQGHFGECGVTRGDIDLLTEQIERPFLKDQRDEVWRKDSSI